ncbi:aminotransferase class IV [Leptolyngbya sp. GGD]|uniref:aminotransferase class IV n=1 Tax=Leptolyngbya sp. GGD TaxID=2997907 RepID=UPI00227AEBEA|nr:aminotransferase class IV [Leptolyngbya sp. GGD]MCY6494567.1 aminotransferase class IV [Leptolyngbya sp. GGD]
MLPSPDLADWQATEIAWHNNEIVPREVAAPSIASHSLHLGIGVFDGMMAYRNEEHYYVHEIEAHLERLHHGSHQMQLPFHWSIEELKAGIDALLAEVPPATYYIRPIVYRSAPQINVTGSKAIPVDVTIFGVRVPRDNEKSLACQISPYQRISSRAVPVSWKICGSYVNSYLVRLAAEAQGFNDGIMLDQEGRIAEASAANLFLLKHEALVTPKLTSDIFPGITRKVLLRLAQNLGIETIEREIFPEELSHFEGAFLASTLMEMKPLHQIGHFQYKSSNHLLFRRLLQAFQEITHQ